MEPHLAPGEVACMGRGPVGRKIARGGGERKELCSVWFGSSRLAVLLADGQQLAAFWDDQCSLMHLLAGGVGLESGYSLGGAPL